jgi:hypothetical protein
MKRLSTLFAAVALAAPMSLVACTDDTDVFDGEQIKDDNNGKTDASVVATFIEITWSGSFLTDFAFNDKQVIQDHLLYTIGQLNGMGGVGRLDHLNLTNIRKEAVGSKTKITYTATMPVAWGKRNSVPSTVTLKLPTDMSSDFIAPFVEKFKHDCVDFGAHDVDEGSMWYYFRPANSACRLTASDVSTVVATTAPSLQQTTGKFPEYHKIWEDNKFNAVTIFGKFEDGATTAADAGIAAWREFVVESRRTLSTIGTVTSIPANLPATPPVTATDIEFSVTKPDGKKVSVIILLSDNVRIGLQNPAFRKRYEDASTRADLIMYNGHAGLGANIKALSRAGKWVRGQYVIAFEDGCDTYAYIDSELGNAHKAINPDDTTGFKYVDTLANALPAFFASMSNSAIVLLKGLIDIDHPQTYEQMFRSIDSSQVILVTGEQDNTFVPGGGGGGGQAWAGFNESMTLAKSKSKQFMTPVLAAGNYTFDITGSGDADLYVRIGAAPSTTTFQCRPFKTGSNESCLVNLPAPTTIGVMVRGFSTSSTVTLVGKKI